MSIHTITIPTKNECRASECELRYSRHQKGVQGCYYKPSIHTILSQEIKKFRKISTISNMIKDKRFGEVGILEVFLGSFATRIVEEAQREECICAAIIDSNNRVFRGHRHHDAIHAMSTRPGTAQVVEEGFITSKNRFVGRREAMDIQIAAGKMAKSNKGVDLFSEDLY